MASNGSDRHQRIVQRILAELEAGRVPDEALLKDEFPDEGETVERLLRALTKYERLTVGLKRHGPVATGRLVPGTRLGDFEIDSFVAAGGMGEVYRARQGSLGDRLVAIKVVRQELAEGEEGERVKNRFRREALASSLLHHPNLAEVFGFGSEGDLFFYAMRLVEGPTAHQLPKHSGGADEIRWIVARIAEVAAALSVVHQHGLVHRDVKASNIILEGMEPGGKIGAHCSAVLVDFGLVQSIDPEALTRTRGSPATHAYAPPELLLGSEVDARADVFSLGVTLHDLLSGRRPQDRPQASAGLEPIGDLAPDLPKDLAAMVSKAVDPQAAYRYADASALAADLRAFLAGRSVSARHPGLMERTVRSVSARPMRAFAMSWGLLLLAVLIVLAITGVWQIVSGVGRTTAALRVGDIITLEVEFEGLTDLPGATRFLPSYLRQLERRLSSSPEDPARQVLNRLDVNDYSGALLAAATGISRQGGRADQVLKQFLLQHLGPGANARVETLRPALVATARLLTEQPDRTLEEVRWSAPFRDRLEILVFDPNQAADIRLNALWALSGCGTLRHIERLADIALDHPLGSEEHRLAWLAVASIVLRSHPEQIEHGEAGPQDVQECVLGWLKQDVTEERRGHLDRADWINSMECAWSRLLHAAILYERDRGQPISMSRYLDLIDGFSSDPALLIALAREPGVRERLQKGPQIHNLPEVVSWVGKCIAFGDPEILSSVRSWYGNPAALDHAWEECRPIWLMNNRRQILDLDPDTVLGTASSGSEVEELECLREAVAAPPLTAALWDLSASVVRLAGQATGAAAVRAKYTEGTSSGECYWRLSTIAGSALELQFFIPLREGQQKMRLSISHLGAARNVLPYSGVVELRVEIDGKPLGNFHVREIGWVPGELQIDGRLLSSGPHVIRLSVGPGTTTTYRIREARLEVSRP